MKEQGIVIFPDGDFISFGEYVHVDEANYHNSPTHEESFIKEIVSSFKFKLFDLNYDYDSMVYMNAILLTQEGLILIFNNTKTTKSETESLCYVTPTPTEEQKQTLEENDFDSIFEINDIYEFTSCDTADFIKHDSFKDYLKSKSNQK